MQSERRNRARIAMHSKANLQRGDQSIECESENLSMKGAFVRTVRQMDLNDVVVFTLTGTSVRAKAKVVRVTSTGMGLEFEKTLLE